MRAKLLITAAVGALMCASVLLSGCNVTDPIYESAYPEQGKITLTTDWGATNIDTPPATGYTVRVGDYSATLTGAVNAIDHLFDPGDYTIYAYNTAGGIAVNGTTVTANYTGTLDWFYTGVQGVTVVKDTDHAFTVAMAQQVRQLTLSIEPAGGTADHIATITTTLSGVAGSYDMASRMHGAESTIALAFTKNTDGKWTTTVRLLGITGSEQKLTGTISFVDGMPGDAALTGDLTTELASFNDNKKEPFSLSCEVETPTETGFTATITGWTTNNESSGIAN